MHELWMIISRPREVMRVIRADGPNHPLAYLALKACIGVAVVLALFIVVMVAVGVR